MIQLTTYVVHVEREEEWLNWLLSQEGQSLAVWITAAVTIIGLLFIYQQVSAMREARDLEAFNTFQKLWENEEVRESRRVIYRTFGIAVRKVNQVEKQAEEERLIGNATNNDKLREHVERVIYRCNLVGTLWAEELLSKSLRKKLIGYIHKTVIMSWDCLFPYIQHIRGKREEVPGSITYAAPFQRLLEAAEIRLGKQCRPKPTDF